MQEIIDELLKNQDMEYKKFQEKLIPSVEADKIIGVRTPSLRLMAKRIYNENKYVEFFSELPHKYFEENQIHGFLFSWIKDYDFLVTEVEKFFPYIDNWATCDQISPCIFQKNKEKIFPKIVEWCSSGDDEEYKVRFSIRMMMNYFLDSEFSEDKLYIISDIKSEKYYVQMMIAWFFATALAKQYSSALKIIKEQELEPWTHNKAIQKALESFRVSDEHKNELRNLKIQGDFKKFSFKI